MFVLPILHSCIHGQCMYVYHDTKPNTVTCDIHVHILYRGSTSMCIQSIYSDGHGGA